ncbi:MAG TPA: contact-dependent growth inhibition system immunity protein [Longimicrobiales bacterium]
MTSYPRLERLFETLARPSESAGGPGGPSAGGGAAPGGPARGQRDPGGTHDRAGAGSDAPTAPPDGPTAARRLAAYIERQPATALHATAREIDALLGAGLCEYQLAHIVLYELGCAYDPAHDGLEVSDWLRTLRDRLRAAADRQRYADALG